eukprot:SAG31_NODE_11104_length_1066_cov_0.935884_1_plen_77_part_00
MIYAVYQLGQGHSVIMSRALGTAQELLGRPKSSWGPLTCTWLARYLYYQSRYLYYQSRYLYYQNFKERVIENQLLV